MSAKRRPACQPRLDHLDGRILLSGPAPTFPTPHIIKTAYYDNFNFDVGGASVACNGSGQTIAIVDVGTDSTISAGTTIFDDAYDQTAPFPFSVYPMAGATPASLGWSTETSLDVEWAHSFAPQAGIDLVEAKSASTADLMAAVNFARSLPGVSVVSMSWGSAELSGDTAYNAIFTTPAGHRGVTFVAAAGDYGADNSSARNQVGVLWPASDPNVLSVGGTVLDTDANGDYLGETAWSLGGGGHSQIYGEPAYQEGVQASGYRTVPDVSMDASDLPFYDTAAGGWNISSGTSFATPMWAGIIAKANQGRALLGLGSLDGPSQTLPLLYSSALRSDFHDITTGSNGVYSAHAGYDLVTGLGSPYSGLIISVLSGVPIYHSNAVAALSLGSTVDGPSAVAMAALPAPEAPRPRPRRGPSPRATPAPGMPRPAHRAGPRRTRPPSRTRSNRPTADTTCTTEPSDRCWRVMSS